MTVSTLVCCSTAAARQGQVSANKPTSRAISSARPCSIWCSRGDALISLTQVPYAVTWRREACPSSAGAAGVATGTVTGAGTGAPFAKNLEISC
jgi:hypothetical protein|eukprot:SAG25_NODE_88_length_16343_cov_89.495383_2_plen_94_part_00